MAIGTSRLGLKAGLITRVGDEQMGRFVLEQMRREGVALQGIRTDPQRLTALVLLAVEDEGVSPTIFYRTDCADMALSEEDIDEAFIASAGAVVVTGTHFSRPNSDAAQRKAIRIAKANGRKVAFDIDYRPTLWGLTGHAAGFERYVKSDSVSQKLKSILVDCDLIVGTEEEIMIAAGADGALEALQAIRALSSAIIVLKRGPMGCIVLRGAKSHGSKNGIVGRGFPIEVYNVLGAGDAFMSRLPARLAERRAAGDRGHLGERVRRVRGVAPAVLAGVSDLGRAQPLPRARQRASRAAQGPGDQSRSLGNHAPQPARLADGAGDRSSRAARGRRRPARRTAQRLEQFKLLAVEAATKVAGGQPGFGMLLDSTYGQKALYKAAKAGLWLGAAGGEARLPSARPRGVQSRRMAGHAHGEMPVLLPPGRR